MAITENIKTTIERINKEGNCNAALEPSNPWLTSYIYFHLLDKLIHLTVLKVKEGRLGFREYKTLI